MKEKVLAILKPLLASKGFKADELEGLAEIAAKNLTETSTDEEIQNAASGLVPYAEMMQKVGNRMVTAVQEKYKGWIEPSKKQTTDTSKKEEEPEPEPKGLSAEDVQKMIQEGIAAGLKPYQEREERARLRSLIDSHEKVKSIPEVFRNRYSLEKEEDLENVASQIESDYALMKQALVKSGEFATPPESGSGSGTTDELISRLHDMGKHAEEAKKQS